MVIQHNKLVELIAADSVPLASLTADSSTIPPESTLTVYSQEKVLKEHPGSLHEFLDDFRQNNGQFEFLLNWGPNCEATWESRSIVPGNSILSYFERMQRSMKDQYKHASKKSL